uniref:Uncharacterized protein n=1 Tax=Arundo donax TaxID=35708 RepID=A0A0A9GYA9_ARUDO
MAARRGAGTGSGGRRGGRWGWAAASQCGPG